MKHEDKTWTLTDKQYNNALLSAYQLGIDTAINAIQKKQNKDIEDEINVIKNLYQ